MRRSIAGSRFIVTGASSGIGRALAIELARQQARLIINARGEEKLRALEGEIAAGGAEVQCVVGDVTDSATRQHLLEVARERYGGLDVLVNNAGIGAFGHFATADPERLRRIMEVNFFAAAELTRAALPLLREAQAPLIVNVSSILGHRGIPHASEYCASKFALQGFSESLRAELSSQNIDVLVVSPGTTETDFYGNVLEKEADLPWEGNKGVSAEVVAQRIARAIAAGRHEIIPSLPGRLLVWLNRLSPRLADAMMARYG